MAHGCNANHAAQHGITDIGGWQGTKAKRNHRAKYALSMKGGCLYRKQGHWRVMMSECQDWESLDWAIVFEDQDHDTMYIPDKAVALKLFEAKASNWNCHLFYRVSSEAGIDYPPSEMQVLQKEKQQQAETIEKMDRDFDELAHKDTEKAETIKQLQARIARLEEKLGAHVHIKKIGLFNAKESDFRALDNSESVLNEAPQQSYSAIQADAIMEFKHHILNVLIGDDGDDIIIAQSVFDDYSDQLRQKTKGGG